MKTESRSKDAITTFKFICSYTSISGDDTGLTVKLHEL
jgi:hypothetical protein